MSDHSSRPVRFRDYLPEVLRGDERTLAASRIDSFKLSKTYLKSCKASSKAFPGDLRLTVDVRAALRGGLRKIEIKVKRPLGGPTKVPGRYIRYASREVTPTPPRSPRTIPERLAPHPSLCAMPTLPDSLSVGVEIVLHAGGLPDLFNPDLTPPPQFARRLHLDEYRAEPDSSFLSFLAGWIGLPLRDELIPRAGETDPHGHYGSTTQGTRDARPVGIDTLYGQPWASTHDVALGQVSKECSEPG